MRHVLAIAALLTACGRSSSQSKRKDAALPAETKDAAAKDASIDAGRHADPAIRAQLDALAPVSKPPRPISRKHRRGDCSTKYAPRPDRDPNPMCRVDGGTFMFGGGMHMINYQETAYVHVDAVKTTVSSFYIDQLEVTTAQAAMFLNAHGNVCDGIDRIQNSPDATPCVYTNLPSSKLTTKHGRFVPASGKEQNPEIAFSWEGALRYCAWVGKSVPSSAQWEYAARHDPKANKDTIYPWGDTWVSHVTACNVSPCDPRPVIPAASPDEPPDPDELPVGVFDGTKGRADGSSPWGLHDMAGGADEIVFACANQDATCQTGESCECKIQFTPNSSAPSLERLRVDHRVDDTVPGFGLTGVRCVLRNDR